MKEFSINPKYINFTSQLLDIYKKNYPFPHISLKNFFQEEIFIEKIRHEFMEFNNFDGEKNFYGSIGKRWCSTYNKLPSATSKLIDYFNSHNFIVFLEEITGIKNLLPDPSLNGGGMHQTKKGGFLKIHADFNYHEDMNAYRRINLLFYLNKGWERDYKGFLGLYKKDNLNTPVKEIEPAFNTLALFNTTDTSFHGYPEPLNCDESISRNSIAIYYYTKEPFENFGSRGKNTNTLYIEDINLFKLIMRKISNIFNDFKHPRSYLLKLYKKIFKNINS